MEQYDNNNEYEEEEMDVSSKHNSTDYYKELGVDKNSTKKEIKKEFKKKSQKYHPDLQKLKTKRAKKFYSEKQSKINSIKDILLDEEKRMQYDILGNDRTQVVLKSKNLFNSIEDYKNYLNEEKKYIRKRYKDLLTKSKSRQYIYLHFPKETSYIPIISLMDTHSNFSMPLSKFIVVNFLSNFRYFIPNKFSFQKAVEIKKFSKSNPLDFISTNFEFFSNFGIANLSFQKQIEFTKSKKEKSDEKNKKKKESDDKKNKIEKKGIPKHIILKLSNSIQFYNLVKYLGPDIMIKKPVILRGKNYSEHNLMNYFFSFNFPIFRRTICTGIETADFETRITLSEPSTKLLFDYNFLKLSKSTFLKGSFELNIIDKMETEYGVIKSDIGKEFGVMLYTQIFDDITHFGVGLNYSRGGLALKLYFKRNLHHFSIPFFLPNTKFINYFVPISTCILPFIIYNFSKGFQKFIGEKKKENKIVENRNKIYDSIDVSDDRKECQKEVLEIYPKILKSFENEKKKHGLVIVKGLYGNFSEIKSYKKFVSEKRLLDYSKKPWILVTNSLQYQVKDSKLHLKNIPKSILPGFYDPCPNEEKKLYIEYKYKNELFKVFLDDEQECLLPINKNYLFNNHNKNVDKIFE